MTVAESPFVSVVVTARNAVGEIGACLTSLERVDYPADRREVIVVDDGSTDGTQQLLHRRSVPAVRGPARGVGHARNAGIEASRGEIVAFTDTDCAVSTDWLRRLVAPFDDEAVGVVAGAIVPYPPETAAQRYAARRMSHSQLRPMSHPARPFGMTPNVAVRRDALMRAGMFDTRFPGGGWEDADLCWRLTRRTGLELRYAPGAVVFHRYRETRRAFFAQHWRYGYGLGLLQRKYRDELSWGWPERRRAYVELAGSALRCLVASRRHDEDSQFDFLRALGQRLGFLWACWTSRVRPAPSAASR